MAHSFISHLVAGDTLQRATNPRPKICTLHDVGPNYLVMELVEGETLADRLEKGKLPLEQAVRFGAQIAEALAAAQAKGIIHGDLKPANIMLTKSGVKVLDFGVARSCARWQPIPDNHSTFHRHIVRNRGAELAQSTIEARTLAVPRLRQENSFLSSVIC